MAGAQITSAALSDGVGTGTGNTFTVGQTVDGTADEVQLTVQANGTQTSNILVVENSAGTDLATVDNSGNLVVTGTSDLQGNISDSGGDVTIADNAAVTGTFTVTNASAADAVTLTQSNTGAVAGVIVNSSGTGSLLEVQDAGVAKLTVANGGNVTVTNDLTVSGTAVTVPANSIDGSEVSALLRQKTTHVYLANNVQLGGDAFIFVAPGACTLLSVGLVTTTGVTLNGTNYFNFDVQNLTQTNSVLVSPPTTNTGGTAITADVLYDFGTLQNTSLVANDVLELQITVNNTPSGINGVLIILTYETTG